MTEAQKKEGAEFVALVNSVTGKKYKDVGNAAYVFLKEITLTDDVKLTHKTVEEFQLTDGKPDPEKPNKEAGAKFWQGSIVVATKTISPKIKTDLVVDGVLPAGTYNLFVFGGDQRASFAVTDGKTYSKMDALTLPE